MWTEDRDLKVRRSEEVERVKKEQEKRAPKR
jgi:hypothetical protein